MAIKRSQIAGETVALAFMGLLLVGAGVYECCWAYHWRPTVAVAVQAPAPVLPLLPAPAADAVPGQSNAVVTPSTEALVEALDARPAVADIAPAPPRVIAPVAPASPVPMPPERPVDLDLGPNGRLAPSTAPAAVQAEIASRYDRFTAVYDLTAHVVYLPNGARLEAHSGLGDRLDDPRHVDEPDKGATPPHVYELTLREQPFHGVQALRLNPVGGPGEIFGRAGLLAHTYMLGPNGESNGCVSFKDYDAFLQAFQSGQLKRLAVVARLN